MAFKQIADHLKEFDRVLREVEDWGRRPHSPFEDWQWWIIIAIIGIAVGTLLACFFRLGVPGLKDYSLVYV